jgi:hypothetical protein
MPHWADHGWTEDGTCTYCGLPMRMDDRTWHRDHCKEPRELKWEVHGFLAGYGSYNPDYVAEFDTLDAAMTWAQEEDKHGWNDVRPKFIYGPDRVIRKIQSGTGSPRT